MLAHRLPHDRTEFLLYKQRQYRLSGAVVNRAGMDEVALRYCDAQSLIARQAEDVRDKVQGRSHVLCALEEA